MSKGQTYLLSLSVILVFLLPGSVLPHGGGLDGRGCHHDRKRGGYHCHRSPSVRESPARIERPVQSPQQPVVPTREAAPRPLTPSPILPEKEIRDCVRVIDGDTVELDQGEKVRLIGVDTPETVHPNKPVEQFGKEASTFTRRLVQGQKVIVAYDQTNTPAKHKDKYGRTLAYVYLLNGTLVNLEIIQQGYGFAYIRYPFALMSQFRKAEQKAREQGRGLWEEQYSTVAAEDKPCIDLIKEYGKATIIRTILLTRGSQITIEANGELQTSSGTPDDTHVTPRTICADIKHASLSVEEFSARLQARKRLLDQEGEQLPEEERRLLEGLTGEERPRGKTVN